MKYTEESRKREIEILGSLVNWKDKKVLEVGCGSGNYTKILINFSKNLIAIDPSRDGIVLAKRNIPNCRFVIANGENLPFKEESLEIVFLAFVLHEVNQEKHISILKEIHRTLKNDGKLIILEPTENDPLGKLTDSIKGSNHPQLLMDLKISLEKMVTKGYFEEENKKKYWVNYIWENKEELLNEIGRYYKWWFNFNDKKMLEEKVEKILGKWLKEKPIEIPLELELTILRKA